VWFLLQEKQEEQGQSTKAARSRAEKDRRRHHIAQTTHQPDNIVHEGQNLPRPVKTLLQGWRLHPHLVLQKKLQRRQADDHQQSLRP
jgi:hypothetical protein